MSFMKMSPPIKILASLGAIYGATLTFKLLRFLSFWTRTGSLSRYKYKHNDQDPWAFVTGSSDGIGLGLVQELANYGFNIVLHGRNPTKLEAAKKAILFEHPNIQVRYIIADVCIPGDGLLTKIQEIKEQLQDLHLTVLINNVGGPAPNMDPLYKTIDKTVGWEIDDQISMNIRFTCHLTSTIIPLLIKNNKPALIMNIGSITDAGLPYVAMYSGTKGFINSWTMSLRREMKAEGRDLEVLCVKPMKVTGTSFRIEKSTWNMPDPRTFGRSTLNRIGGSRGCTEGYWGHGIMANVVSRLPEKLLMFLLVKNIREEAAKDKKRG